MAEDVFGIVGSLQAAVFRVERVVAEGGFGVVYRAHHEGFKAAVALKCLKIPGAFSAEQRRAFLQKFQEEGEVLFRLSALIPSVVRPLHVGTLETSKHPFVPFIALEWLDGESLDSVIERRRAAGKPPLDLARVVRMMGPVARARECAHQISGSGRHAAVDSASRLEARKSVFGEGSRARDAQNLGFWHRKSAQRSDPDGRSRLRRARGHCGVHARVWRSRAVAAEALRSDRAVDGHLGLRTVRGRGAHEPSTVRR
jgi:hypothetical protein